jgi:hypothetical protein
MDNNNSEIEGAGNFTNMNNKFQAPCTDHN